MNVPVLSVIGEDMQWRLAKELGEKNQENKINKIQLKQNSWYQVRKQEANSLQPH